MIKPADPPPEADPKGLVRESYRIDGIGDAECRSIFMDWALSLPAEADTEAALRVLLDSHGRRAPDHPMTAVLREALATPAPARRRGGWAGRRGKTREPKPTG
ncbi:MAG: hypothetical protein JJU19_13875 [Pararhodobacter sp.]|nr:hypothetical protein [Pararhodobacter sp.]